MAQKLPVKSNEEMISDLLHRRDLIVNAANIQIQEINNFLAMLGYVDPLQVPSSPDHVHSDSAS